MGDLRRCSPEIERELHDKEARIRELEAKLEACRRLVVAGDMDQSKFLETLASAPPDSEPATPSDQTAVDDLVAEYERDPAKREAIDEARTRLNNNEPAEEAEKCLVCDGSGNLYGHQPEGMYGYTPCHNCKGTGKPPIREPAEGGGGRDISREWTLCEDTGRLAEQGVCPEHGGDSCLRQYAPVSDDPAQQQDAMLERRDALADLDYLSGVLNNPSITTLSQNGWVRLRTSLENIRRYLSRTSDEGTGCVVPEAVRRLPELWRWKAKHDRESAEILHGMDEETSIREAEADRSEHHAKELDRAIAEQGGQRVLDEAGTLNELARRQWEWVDGMGWHNKEPLEYVALIAGEIGELANECRGEDGLTEKAGEEIADVILRCIDMAHQYGIEIGREVVDKIDKNARLEKHPKGRVK